MLSAHTSDDECIAMQSYIIHIMSLPNGTCSCMIAIYLTFETLTTGRPVSKTSEQYININVHIKHIAEIRKCIYYFLR